MVVLRSAPLLVALASACYSPDVRDCTVACNQLADCAPQQVCGSDGFCAAEDVAGRCATIAPPNDAGVVDARPDARPDAPTDAWPLVKLFVRIDGRGSVAIASVGTCDGGSGQTTCAYDVKKDVPLTLIASPKNNWRFESWSEGCAGSPTTSCVITPAANAPARVLFEMIDSDDDAL